jgi:hypothetical protein
VLPGPAGPVEAGVASPVAELRTSATAAAKLSALPLSLLEPALPVVVPVASDVAAGTAGAAAGSAAAVMVLMRSRPSVR